MIPGAKIDEKLQQDIKELGISLNKSGFDIDKIELGEVAIDDKSETETESEEDEDEENQSPVKLNKNDSEKNQLETATALASRKQESEKTRLETATGLVAKKQESVGKTIDETSVQKQPQISLKQDNSPKNSEANTDLIHLEPARNETDGNLNQLLIRNHDTELNVGKFDPITPKPEKLLKTGFSKEQSTSRDPDELKSESKGESIL